MHAIQPDYFFTMTTPVRVPVIAYGRKIENPHTASRIEKESNKTEAREMEVLIERYLKELQFGEMQKFKNMAVIPLLTSLDRSPKYITLKEALERGTFQVTEVSAGGSVPDLKVINKGDIPVLLLDGEELAGAKQNRVVNATILVKQKWEGIIPVSCTERGRWDYVSPQFKDSKVILSHQIRARKAGAVHRSLAADREYRADQGEIWDDIQTMSESASVHSPTSAMKDIFEAKRDNLEDYFRAFQLVDGQKGLLAMIDGKVIGFDVLSLESAYSILHVKLVKSYAIGALLGDGRGKRPKPSLDEAQAFVDKARVSEQSKFKSIGHGWDYRLRGERIVGSSLLWRTKGIHMAFFAVDDRAAHDESMPGYRNRRRFKI